MKLFIAGDFCPRFRVERMFKNSDFKPVFNDIPDLIRKFDYSIVNLECPIVVHDANPIKKCGPNLKTDTSCIDALKYVGFNCITLANNHFYDYGDVGVTDTIESLKKEFDIVGGGRNYDEASLTLYKSICGKALAIINYCEKEFSIATKNRGGSHTNTPIGISYKIKEAKQKADYVVLIIHGGNEHYQLPSPRLKETYRFYVDQGADVVINHHQHCICGYETYHGHPIFYGLGNFCFDKENTHDQKWNKGIAISLELSESEIGFEIIPFEQCDKDAGIHLLSGEKMSSTLKFVNDLNQIIENDEQLEREYKQFMDKTRRTYNAYFEPYNSRILQGLYRRGYLPSFLSERKKLVLQNFLICESHLERVINSLFD